MSRRTRHDQTSSVPSATSLPANPRDDHDNRVRNYLISMGIRTACFVGAFVFTGVLRWVCVALAVVLPYVAVIFANAAQQRRIDVLGSVRPDRRQNRIDGPAAHGSSRTS
ncbi:DUF3099 domain-containing protein [Barrientosiimonas endolithica]|uniref:DUF3099 domain-containing protein n=1 Tax=Barrientosiimonas endolithica TaxID=1535208 RepID=UPI00259B3937|nr:DUF3099 domain-containing protein [Barrientosiimonas endolithica]